MVTQLLRPLAAPALTGLKAGVSTLVGAPLITGGLTLSAELLKGAGKRIFAPTEEEKKEARRLEEKQDAKDLLDRKLLELEINRAGRAEEALNTLVQSQIDQAGAQTQLQRDYLDVLTNTDLLRESEGIRTQNKLEQIAAYQRGQMEQTRELTRRQIESDTIKAWQGITQAEINRDTAMGLGMMQIAYQSGMPNPNTLSAAANFAAQGRAGFTAPKSPI